MHLLWPLKCFCFVLFTITGCWKCINLVTVKPYSEILFLPYSRDMYNSVHCQVLASVKHNEAVQGGLNWHFAFYPPHSWCQPGTARSSISTRQRWNGVKSSAHLLPHDSKAKCGAELTSTTQRPKSSELSQLNDSWLFLQLLKKRRNRESKLKPFLQFSLEMQ